MNTENFKRRLTAILSADVEGYSRLMRDDEVATINTLSVFQEVLTNNFNFKLIKNFDQGFGRRAVVG